MTVDYCERIRLAAMILADGEVPAIDRESVSEHLEGCQACRDEVESLDLRSLLPMNLERVMLPSQMWDRVRAELGEPPVVRGAAFWRLRTSAPLAIAICLLIAVAAGAWVAYYPRDEPHEALVVDDQVDDPKTTDEESDTNDPAEEVRPRTKPKLTYQRLSMQPMAPMDYERIAANGKMKVQVAKPDPKTKTPCRLTVLEKVNDAWREVWTVNPINPIQPERAYVSDDGACVVTIGNASGGPDDTKEQLVIYRDGKLKDRYALEDILQGHDTAAIPRVTICPGGWWRDSFEFIDDQRLCLFVDFAREWVLVDLKRSALVDVSDSDQATCRARARRDIYETLSRDVGGHHFPTYRRLTRFLRAKDRTLFERLLTQPNSLGLPSGYSDDYYTTANRERDLADLALQAIDAGEEDAIPGWPHPAFNRKIEYKRLGSLKIAAKFPRPPTTTDGIVVLWLEPVNGRDKGVAPANAIGIDLEYQFPGKLKLAGKPLSSPVTIFFHGVAPGQYKIRGYWDRKTRYKHLIEKNYWQRTGDAAVATDTIIKIDIGKTAEAEVVLE